MFRILRYDATQKPAWDAFVSRAKNGLFLFNRNYMDYHADRFTDHSLCVLRDDDLFALIPACHKDGRLESHGGLTFGGIVSDDRMKTGHMLEIGFQLKAYMEEHNLASLIYKTIPHIYSAIAAQEDEYALFRLGATVEKYEVSSVICRQRPLPFSERRTRGIRKARKRGDITLEQSQRYESFFEMVGGLLESKYHTQATHTAKEMELLAGRFSQNIALWQASGPDGKILAGVLMYLHAQVAHAQYIAASDEGKQCGALDALFDHLISRVYTQHPYFDFGISTEDAGRQLNAGLITQKEEFGARAIVQETWKLALNQDRREH